MCMVRACVNLPRQWQINTCTKCHAVVPYAGTFASLSGIMPGEQYSLFTYISEICGHRMSTDGSHSDFGGRGATIHKVWTPRKLRFPPRRQFRRLCLRTVATSLLGKTLMRFLWVVFSL